MIITDLEKKIGDLQISISKLNIENGFIHGLFGGNGCGKSTFAKMLVGAIIPDIGIIDNGQISSSDITLMPQKPYMLQRTVYENIIYPLEIRGIAIDVEKIELYLERAGLLDKKKQYARSLSSGEQQKVSFIRTIIFAPKVVILDETLSNLDIDSLEVFMNWILEWQQENNITWIIISHQLNQLEKLCNKMHYMEKGKIVSSII